jgi:hypothetical protein
MTHSSNQCAILDLIDCKDTAEGRAINSPAANRSRKQYELRHADK